MRMENMHLNNGTGSSTTLLIDNIIDNRNSLDKEQTSYDDLLDALRLILKDYQIE